MVAPFMINNVQDVTVNLLKHTHTAIILQNQASYVGRGILLLYFLLWGICWKK